MELILQAHILSHLILLKAKWKAGNLGERSGGLSLVQLPVSQAEAQEEVEVCKRGSNHMGRPRGNEDGVNGD